jgi:hypothetical protein
VIGTYHHLLTVPELESRTLSHALFLRILCLRCCVRSELTIATTRQVTSCTRAHSLTSMQGLNSLRSTVLATLVVVSACLGFGMFAAGFCFACGKARERWRAKRPESGSGDQENELMRVSQNSQLPFSFSATDDHKVS